MRTLTKAIILFCGLSVSACSFTQDVLQNGYDNRLESECANAYPTNPNSIHIPQVCNAIQDGTYISKTDAKDKKGWE